MGGLVYLLSAATALACAWLLLAAYQRSRARLLFWSGLCFVFLTANNVLVFMDLVLVPGVAPSADLFIWRNIAALMGLAVLVYGLVWDTQ